MTRRALALAFALLTSLLLIPAAHAADRDFTTRFAADQFGDMALIGNGLMTCPAADSGCAAAQNGTATTEAAYVPSIEITIRMIIPGTIAAIWVDSRMIP